MKLRAITAATLSAGLCPALALCAEGGEGGRPWFSLLFFTLNFAAFVFILVFYAGPYVGKFFRDRGRLLRETLRRSEAEVERAEELAAEAAARQARLEADKAQLAAAMEAQTARELERMRVLANEEAARISHDAELSAGAELEAARRRLRARLAELAAGRARELIAKNIDSTDQGRLLEDFLDRLRGEAW